jgi:hypothetical protein
LAIYSRVFGGIELMKGLGRSSGDYHVIVAIHLHENVPQCIEDISVAWTVAHPDRFTACCGVLYRGEFRRARTPDNRVTAHHHVVRAVHCHSSRNVIAIQTIVRLRPNQASSFRVFDGEKVFVPGGVLGATGDDYVPVTIYGDRFGPVIAMTWTNVRVTSLPELIAKCCCGGYGEGAGETERQSRTRVKGGFHNVF